MEDPELEMVAQQLSQIEAVLQAETKRRIEANQIMNEYIANFMSSIEEAVTNKVDSQFKALQSRVNRIDSDLSTAEQQFGEQEELIQELITNGSKKADKQMADASLLLRNVKGSFKVQKEELDKTESKLIKEVQMLLVNDKAQWSQTKSQIIYKLHKLKSMGEVQDFAESLNNLATKLEEEKSERKKDDQEIIDLLNDVCLKIYAKFEQNDKQNQ